MRYKKPLWEVFKKLVKEIKQDHIENRRVGGHDFYHALMVAQYGEMIAESRDISLLVWVAGLCHNTDRLFPEQEQENRIKNYLKLTDFNNIEKKLVVEAVKKHGEPNKLDDSHILIALKDADRLANLGALIIIRASQFYNNIPACEPDYLKTPNPKATYHNPTSVFNNLNCFLEWEKWLRLPKAKKLAKPRFKLLRACIKDIIMQIEETGLGEYALHYKNPKS